MATLKEMMERRAFLERKLSLLGVIKDWVETNWDGGTGISGVIIEKEVSDEVLLDLDAFCVAPVNDEIERLEGLEVDNEQQGKKGKGAGRKAKGKPKARGRARKKA